MHRPARSPKNLALSLLAVALLPILPASADWPQWRGPGRDAKAPDEGLIQQWPAEGPPLDWRLDGFGAGYSSVAVAGQRIYTLGDYEGREGQPAEGQYVVAAARDGSEILWRTRIGKTWQDRYLGPRSTPTIDGDRVYALSTDGTLVCLAAADGKVIWQRSLPEDFGGVVMSYEGRIDWKFAESPLVDGERVIVTPGSKQAGLVALNKSDGKEIWRTRLPDDLGEQGGDGAGYSSVVISHGAGVKQYVQLLGRGLVGVDAADGRFLWHYNRVANAVANISTPLVDGDHVFASTGYETGAVLLKLRKTEAGVAADEVYFLDHTTFQNHHGNMILHEGYVYAGTAHNKGFPIALELKTGEAAWGPVRNAGSGSAAVAFADGRLYFRYQNGVMVLIEATPEGYQELGSFEIPDVQHESWSHPVIADGHLYLREQNHLLCYDLQARSERAAPRGRDSSQEARTGR